MYNGYFNWKLRKSLKLNVFTDGGIWSKYCILYNEWFSTRFFTSFAVVTRWDNIQNSNITSSTWHHSTWTRGANPQWQIQTATRKTIQFCRCTQSIVSKYTDLDPGIHIRLRPNLFFPFAKTSYRKLIFQFLLWDG